MAGDAGPATTEICPATYVAQCVPVNYTMTRVNCVTKPIDHPLTNAADH